MSAEPVAAAPSGVGLTVRVRACAACLACDYTAAWGKRVPVPPPADWRCRGCGERDWCLVTATLPRSARPGGPVEGPERERGCPCPDARCPVRDARGRITPA